MATQNEPIAVIGTGCRFPGGASSPSKLWNLLHHPYDLTQKVPPSRFNINAFYHPDGEHHGTTNTSKSYFLSEDPTKFDATFFSINSREAEALDPQQRLLLETVYEALEAAGLSIEEMQGTPTAVYVGLMCADYYDVLMRDIEDIPQYLATGTARSMMSNRLSYFFDWKGPSMTIDTACSSSLVAVHNAIATLRSGQSRTAIAAGANLIFGPEMYIGESNLHMLSPTGRSQMWDSKADGYARGEGTAAVVLKTLKNALEDGDEIDRQTGVNSDGRTKGITMPSASSQAQLIRQTYARARLDCTKPSDRCQYFEAHGTGTPAGDPIEAEAISSAFFPSSVGKADTQLHVGSVKTVIGHLEGAAGLAGVIKAGLAIKEKTIPPNLHFNNLNPAITPFIEHLKISVEPVPWPSTEGPLRASVNTFGFGGTNAHAILESYQAPPQLPKASASPPLIPFTISATSEDSLLQNISNLSDYISDHEVDVLDLGYTLLRRSVFPIKASYVASSTSDLLDQLEKVLIAKEDNPSLAIGTRTPTVKSKSSRKILGVFTGQGAQWPEMGKQLILNIPLCSQTINDLDKSLSTLPDAPRWSLREEIMAPAEKSLVGQAEFSQPLCTAVQVALVDVLAAIGITFHSVVGHSSGEIGAAYAAGRLSASDAIRIAYYRGLHAHLARGRGGETGAMMAAGLSFNEAAEFCDGEEFKGKVSIAASNAPKTVTLSGNKDAVEKAHATLDAKNVFARLLKVDTAYHSNHMLPCIEPYRASLLACKISPKPSTPRCTWISSVHLKNMSGSSSELEVEYWIDNLISPVRFFEATSISAKDYGPFDAAVEIGPHPALKGPVAQTFKHAVNSEVPYSGALSRGEKDSNAFAKTVGFLWNHIDSRVASFQRYLTIVSDEKLPHPKLLKNLPTYSWDHSRAFWFESRNSRNYRNRVEPPHELLGARVVDDTAVEYRWKNILRLDELPWVSGHKFQHQTLVPAAFYCSTALESSKVLANGKPIQLVELHDIDIERAINLEQNNASVEVIFSLKPGSSSKDNDEQASAEFWCTAAQNGKPMSKIFSGRIFMRFGAPSADVLCIRNPIRPVLGPLNVDRFYDSLANVGLEFTGIFRGIEKGWRRMHISSLEGRRCLSDTGVLVHPAFLDMALHATLAAYASPGDERFWTPYLPRRISKMKFNIAQCEAAFNKETALAGMDGYITEVTPTTTNDAATYVGDIDVFDPATGEVEIQIEGLQMQSFTTARPSQDRELYLQTIWEKDISSGIISNSEILDDDPEKLYLVDLGERLSYAYMRHLRSEISPENVPENHRPLFNWIDHVMEQVSSATHPSIKPEWRSDDLEELKALASKYPDCVDLELMKAVGNNLPDVVRGTTTMLEHMLPNGLLDRLYTEGIGMATSNKYVTQAMKKIGHRYPQMRVLEIGAGTGGATKGIFKGIGDAFAHYTFTDISTGFFMKAREVFVDYADRMTFSLLNCEKDPLEQGYEAHSFDVIVASNVLHATEFLEKTMTNVRQLLKPGGYLCLLECTGHLERTGFLMAGLPGWWLGGADGRPYRPTISPPEWDKMLRKTGFSGVDFIVNDFKDTSRYTVSVILSQALDDDVQKLREPLKSNSSAGKEFVVIGGATAATTSLIQGLSKNVPGWETRKSTVFSTWEQAVEHTFPFGTTVLSVADLDEPIFKAMNPQRLKGMQAVINSAESILWVTKGCRADNPHANMAVGLGRSLVSEMPHLRLQFLDVSSSDNVDTIIGETLVRLEVSASLETRKDDLLWSIEPEMIYEQGSFLLPRVKPIQILNDKLNATRRVITKEVDSSSNKVAVVPSSGGDRFDFAIPEDLQIHPESEVEMAVSFSSLFAVKVEGRFLYLVLGYKTSDSKSPILGLSTSNQSRTTVPKEWSVPAKENTAEYLQFAMAALLAQEILNEALPGIFVYEPSLALAKALSSQAVSAGKSVVVGGSTQGPASSSQPWIRIHPSLSKRAIREILPTSINSFIDFSGAGGGIKDAISNASCMNVDNFLRTGSANPSQLNNPTAILNQAKSYADSVGNEQLEPSLIVAAASLRNGKISSFSPFSIVDWRTDTTLAVDVKPFTQKHIFDSNKSYLLAGLTGDLRQSICRWMIGAGARNLIIGSRSVKAGTAWQQELERMGATVLVYTIDFTDKAAVTKLREETSKTMPPIAGVMNGCMVLDDKPFSDMPFDTLERVIRPKILSTINIDAVFDSELDFFVLFSSLAAVNGIPGQSNYAAANMFMSSLAEQRRNRGAVASVIQIGMILGVGYVERSGRFTESALRSYNYLPIPEHEFLQVLSEAVQSGDSKSNRCPEIIIGMVAPPTGAEREKPRWHANPRFSFVMHHTAKDDKESGGEVEASIKEQLANTQTKEEILETMQKCFVKQLELILQAASGSIDENAPLTQLGIDSLIAVEIRSWFLKEVGVSLPVLKVLSGASARELCEVASGEYKIGEE
ncbi:polyketide synthase protein [Rutstroemia sp. NJR-2017a BVV2]|nr:polyketide synthase protein [Rutstroemia sp. NJR-2017a BVV2]